MNKTILTKLGKVALPVLLIFGFIIMAWGTTYVRNNYLSTPKLIVTDQANITQLLIKDPFIDVRAFGAKCDGITDDAIAIQNALNSKTTGTVVLPGGTCNYGRQLNITSNKQLIGLGWEGTILQATYPFKTSNNATIYMSGNQNSVANLQIINKDNRVFSILIDDGFKPRLEYVKILGGNKGVQHIGGAEGRFYNLHVVNTLASGLFSNVPDLYTENVYTQNTSYGIYVEGGSQIMIAPHIVYPRLSGIIIVGGNFGVWQDCYLDNGNKHGFEIYDTQYLTVSNCFFYNNGKDGSTSYAVWASNLDYSTFSNIISSKSLKNMKDIYLDSNSASNSFDTIYTGSNNFTYTDSGQNNYFGHGVYGIKKSGTYKINATSGTLIINNITIKKAITSTRLSGSGNANVCVYPNGTLYRNSNATCS